MNNKPARTSRNAWRNKDFFLSFFSWIVVSVDIRVPWTPTTEMITGKASYANTLVAELGRDLLCVSFTVVMIGPGP